MREERRKCLKRMGDGVDLLDGGDVDQAINTLLSPSKECCPGCHRALDKTDQLDKSPPDLQGRPPGKG